MKQPCYMDGEEVLSIPEVGLTKRELFTALALQGLLANPSRLEFPQDSYSSQAVFFADELIKELNQKSGSRE